MEVLVQPPAPSRASSGIRPYCSGLSPGSSQQSCYSDIQQPTACTNQQSILGEGLHICHCWISWGSCWLVPVASPLTLDRTGSRTRSWRNSTAGWPLIRVPWPPAVMLWAWQINQFFTYLEATHPIYNMLTWIHWFYEKPLQTQWWIWTQIH